MVNSIKLEPTTEYEISTTRPPVSVLFSLVTDEQLAEMKQNMMENYSNHHVVTASFELTPSHQTHKFTTGDMPINIAWFDSQAVAEYVQCNPTKNDSKPG